LEVAVETLCDFVDARFGGWGEESLYSRRLLDGQVRPLRFFVIDLLAAGDRGGLGWVEASGFPGLPIGPHISFETSN
jgi:hypothetical protein